MGSTIGGKFYSGSRADAMAEFLGWFRKHDANPETMVVLTSLVNQYLDAKAVVVPGGDAATTTIPQASPIRLRGEEWDDVPDKDIEGKL